MAICQLLGGIAYWFQFQNLSRILLNQTAIDPLRWLLTSVKSWRKLSFRSCFITSDLQFGFKPGFSTDLCSGVLRNVVSQYIHKGSKVYSCFLDATKAFDRVNYELLLKLPLKRQIPCAILRFLFAWYRDQLLSVRWNSSLSSSFGVSNGVYQGGVLSPILFTI